MGILLPGDRGWLRGLGAAILRRLHDDKSWQRKLDEGNLLQQKRDGSASRLEGMTWAGMNPDEVLESKAPLGS
ncbi:UNVERIFIED_CONTAM: hypothetical protein K2H54_023724 [Gekko kuhli]